MEGAEQRRVLRRLQAFIEISEEGEEEEEEEGSEGKAIIELEVREPVRSEMAIGFGELGL